MTTYEEKELLKDDVLKYLLTTDGVYSFQIAEKLNRDIELIDYLIYQLKLDGYIVTHVANEEIFYIHSRGRFFLNIDGGHSYPVFEEKRKHKYEIFTTSVTVANAIIIIGIAFMSIYVQWDSNKKQDKIDKLEDEISVLKRENLGLTNSKSSSTKK